MKIKPHGLLDALKQASTYAIIAALLTLSIDYFYVRFAPASAFFEYGAITNVKAEPFEKPEFYSTTKITTLRPLTSQEEIVCQTENGLIQFGERSVSFVPSGKSKGFRQSPNWTLESAVIPNINALCHLEASISMSLRYGVSKYQFIISNDFGIVKTESE